ncbi:Protein CBR-ING-3 [Caenorhabditis briggsae]|uniref:Inhibitor of growth protein n=1 Tax=Caenorhabditis briggsae TaxID=6238 RepID=A8XYC8_CAEBR|nr:Protein CBR-ING-3 [Caenorhabditis briggsae]CAP37645.2 Protein CBR-ING-3 [Caenorhabditis briggsae]
MLFLDDFLEMLDELPAELKDRSEEIRRIDYEVESRLNRNREAINEFFQRSGVNMSAEQRREKSKGFQDEFETIKILAQKKFFIAEKMQELLKKYQTHLDKEKTNFQCEMEADNSGVTEMIEKRYTQHIEAVITARKERKRRHRVVSSRASTVASGPLISRDSNDKIQRILQEGMRLRLDFSDDSAHSAMSSAIPSPAPRGRPPKINRDQMFLSSSMIASDDCMTPIATPTARRRSNTNALRGTVSIPSAIVSMSRGESSGHFSPNPSERSWSNAGIDESPTPTSNLTTPVFSSGPHIPNYSTPQSSQVLQNSAFVVSESRHGRTRKLTSRVQEMFKETLQRQRNHGNSIIALQERMTAASAAQQYSTTSPAASGSPTPASARNGSPNEVDDDVRTDNAKRGSFAPNDHREPNEHRTHQETDDEDEGDQRRWCFCDEKSYGEMVRCDNPDCNLRWFHYPCIGMVEPPVGTWFCPRCVVKTGLEEEEEKEEEDEEEENGDDQDE